MRINLKDENGNEQDFYYTAPKSLKDILVEISLSAGIVCIVVAIMFLVF